MSKLGASVSSAKRDGIGRLFAAGMPCVSCIDQNMIAEAHANGAIVAFRTQRGSMGEDNPPSFMDVPLEQQYQLGIDYLNSQLPIWQQNAGADYYVINNEQEPGTIDHARKLNEFHLGAMHRADQLGIKLLICNFATGNPSDDGGLTLEQRWEPMLDAIGYACVHGHAIGLHAHHSDLMATGEDVAFRHERTLRYFASHGLYPKVFITELSNGVEGIEPNLAGWWDNVSRWDLHVMASQWADQVIGAALYGWTAVASLTPAVDVWEQWLIDHPAPIDPPPPAADYVFDHWTKDGSSATPNPLSFLIVDDHVTLEAAFIPKPPPKPLRFFVNVTVTPAGAGTVVLDPPQPVDGYEAGTLVTATAVAA